MRLALVGDVMLGRLVNAHLRERPPESVWGNTLRVLQAADLRVCNLECVLSDGGQPWSATPKVFHFRSDTRNVAVLRAAGIDFVSLANNHTLDYGAVALAEMLALLDHEGIQHAGAGRCLEEAAQPAVIQTPEGTVGMVAFTDNQPEWEATSKQAGVLYVPVDLADPRAVRLSERVRQAREQVDLLIVSAHWGPNWGDGPPPEQAPFAHALIDAGADLIFGHSGHVVRGVELYRERPILYCAGDFIDDYMVDPVERNDESCIFVPQMLPTSQQRLLGLRLYPTMIDNCQARLADGEQAERIARKVGQLCAERQTPLPWQPTGRYLECELGAADRASTGVTAGTSGPHSAASSVGFVEFLVGGS